MSMKSKLMDLGNQYLGLGLSEDVNLRKAVKDAEVGPLKQLKDLYRTFQSFSIPTPLWLGDALWAVHKGSSVLEEILYSSFISEPLYRSACAEIGPGFKALKAPYLMGKGKIVLGENVSIFGKLDIVFASILDELPVLKIGNNCQISHGIGFTIAKSVTIGNDVRIATGSSFQDTNGHPLDPESRRAGGAPSQREVSPIVIGNNVWIGVDARILPGVRIGDNSIIGAGAIVRRSIPPNRIAIPELPQVLKLDDLLKFTKNFAKSS